MSLFTSKSAKWPPQVLDVSMWNHPCILFGMNAILEDRVSRIQIPFDSHVIFRTNYRQRQSCLLPVTIRRWLTISFRLWVGYHATWFLWIKFTKNGCTNSVLIYINVPYVLKFDFPKLVWWFDPIHPSIFRNTIKKCKLVSVILITRPLLNEYFHLHQ